MVTTDDKIRIRRSDGRTQWVTPAQLDELNHQRKVRDQQASSKQPPWLMWATWAVLAIALSYFLFAFLLASTRTDIQISDSVNSIVRLDTPSSDTNMPEPIWADQVQPPPLEQTLGSADQFSANAEQEPEVGEALSAVQNSAAFPSEFVAQELTRVDATTPLELSEHHDVENTPITIAPPPVSAQVVENPLPEVREGGALAAERTNVDDSLASIESTAPVEAVVNLSESDNKPDVLRGMGSEGAPDDAVLAFLDSWARAWRNRDSAAFVAHFDKSYYQGDSRAAWEENRRLRFLIVDEIQVEVADVSIQWIEDGLVEVGFTQTYADARYQDKSYKRLTLEQADDGTFLILDSVAE